MPANRPPVRSASLLEGRGFELPVLFWVFAFGRPFAIPLCFRLGCVDESRQRKLSVWFMEFTALKPPTTRVFREHREGKRGPAVRIPFPPATRQCEPQVILLESLARSIEQIRARFIQSAGSSRSPRVLGEPA
jgi:hypothetical protein